MKEVTICFSFSVKDGRLKALLNALNTLPGSSIVGIKNTKKQKTELKNGLLLLTLLSDISPGVYIQCVALSGRKSANRLDDLNTEIPTHARSDKP